MKILEQPLLVAPAPRFAWCLSLPVSLPTPGAGDSAPGVRTEKTRLSGRTASSDRVAEAPLGKKVAGGPIDFVPFLAGQREAFALGGVSNSLGGGGPQNGLDMRRVAADPGDGDGGVGHGVFLGDPVNDHIQGRELGIVEENPLEEAVLERGPRLNGDVPLADNSRGCFRLAPRRTHPCC